MFDEEERAEIGRKVRLAIWGALGAIAIVAAIASAATPDDVEIGPYEPKPVEIAKPAPAPPAPPKVEEPPPPEPIAPAPHAGHHRPKKHHSDAAPGTAAAVGDIDLHDFAKPGAIRPPPPPVPEDGGGGRYGGKHCTKGKPCGNTCIPVSHQCHK